MSFEQFIFYITEIINNNTQFLAITVGSNDSPYVKITYRSQELMCNVYITNHTLMNWYEEQGFKQIELKSKLAKQMETFMQTEIKTYIFNYLHRRFFGTDWI